LSNFFQEHILGYSLKLDLTTILLYASPKLTFVQAYSRHGLIRYLFTPQLFQISLVQWGISTRA